MSSWHGRPIAPLTLTEAAYTGRDRAISRFPSMLPFAADTVKRSAPSDREIPINILDHSLGLVTSFSMGVLLARAHRECSEHPSIYLVLPSPRDDI